jgi:hypothetical protein
MWPINKTKQKLIAEVADPEEVEVQAKAQVLTLEDIEREIPDPKPDTHREVLNQAKQLLGYKPRDILLGNVLAELEIETLDSKQVKAYMDSKNQGHGIGRKNFIPYKFTEYRYEIPVHVLNKAIQIKEKLPEVEFIIYHYEEGDPFLFVMHNGYGWYIEAWDEPTFEGREAR